VSWKKCEFVEALRELLYEFTKEPAAQTLALVWRTPDEYSVMDCWILEKILPEMDEKTLRVVLWLDRDQAARLISVIGVGV